jgi:hypothetical protein
MIYSIAVLDLCDFESIGHRMPKGTGVDTTVDDSAVVPAHKKKRCKVVDKVANQTSGLIRALEMGDERESKMSALRILVEFGTDAERKKAKAELCAIAFGKSATAEEVKEDDKDDDDCDVL